MMGLKARLAELASISLLKWALLILFAGFIYYFVSPKYDYLGNDRAFNRVTGEIVPIAREKAQ